MTTGKKTSCNSVIVYNITEFLNKYQTILLYYEMQASFSTETFLHLTKEVSSQNDERQATVQDLSEQTIVIRV